MKKGNWGTWLALLLGSAASLGCSSSDKINIGNSQPTGSALADYAASWDGYAEAYTFTPDGSDRVRSTVAASGQGHLEVGNAALLSPPTDPNVGYPPSANANPGLGPIISTSTLTEGFLIPFTRRRCRRIGSNWA